jgi:hypothetical protein
VDAASMAPAQIAVPTRKIPQHMQALAAANRVRLARAALKRSIASGEVSALSVVMECPWEAESMSLAELLTSQRRWGRTRARKFLGSVDISENKQLGKLTSRQRLLIVEGLREIPASRELAAAALREPEGALA